MNTLTPTLSREREGEGVCKNERVVLLHGLSRTSRSMAAMAAALQGEGYAVLNWDYPGRRHGFPDLVERFRRLCETLAGPQRTHFIGHSLGGLIIRAGLCRPVPFPLGRILLLGTPGRGALSVTRLQARAWSRHLPGLLGRPAHGLYRDAGWFSELGWPAAEIGMIAGTRRFHPLNPSAWINRWHGATEESDGTVEVDSALDARAGATLTLDVGHTFMPADPRVIAAAIRFIGEGRF